MYIPNERFACISFFRNFKIADGADNYRLTFEKNSFFTNVRYYIKNKHIL